MMPVVKGQEGGLHLLKRLRDLMRSSSHVPAHLQAYMIPSEDAHQSEYLAKCHKRRQFITGFTGSSGLAIVTSRSAALWTDGRYFIQAEKELGPHWTLMKIGEPGVPSPEQWLLSELDMGGRIGFDPYLVSLQRFEELRKTLEEGGGLALTPVTDNLVDIIWGNERPAPPSNPIVAFPTKFSGADVEEKIELVREAMKKEKACALLLSALDEIAWLFNLRGSDVECNPVFFSYALIGLNYAYLFIEEGKMEKSVLETLKGVQIFSYSQVRDKLDMHKRSVLPRASASRGSSANSSSTEENKFTNFWLPMESTSSALATVVPGKHRVTKPSPVLFMKAKKNDTEMAGMREAHIKDAVAHCEFLQWLEHEMKSSTRKSVDEPLNESSVAAKFEEFRRQQDDFIGPSFPTISAAGSNGAYPHHKTGDTMLAHNQVYLVDSGGQYLQGTTDVTRTVSFGEPTQYQKDCYTRVLKAHIALASITFPEKMDGYRLDCIARVPLWEAGKDYRHGTGHGVGHYLNVHEGPSGFHFKPRTVLGPIEGGMCLTIEPGYYEPNAFGIRIENVYAVLPRLDGPCTSSNTTFLSFDPLTLVPISKELLEPALLTQAEIEWLNAYHKKCEEIVGEELKKQSKESVLSWLLKQTGPLG